MASNISRRAFVARAATAASALALPALASSAPTSARHLASKDSDKEVLDLAIVGAGVSGIYTAWRLLTADPASLRILGRPVSTGRRLRVTVFEGSHRVGGRLLSARAPDLSAVCELGGMRFASSQRRVVSLINELDLPHHRFYGSDAQNHAFLRGKHLRLTDLTNPARLPYQLTDAEQECVRRDGPEALMQWGVSKLLPGVAELHGEELFAYLQTADVDGTPLYEHGLWNLVARTMSSEARSLALATIGFDSLGSNANAVNLLMQYLAHTPDVTYHALDSGYDALTWALQRRFESAGGQIVYGAWLNGVSPLTLSDGTPGMELRFAGGCPAVRARGVILAMPRKPIEVILARCPWLTARSAAALTKLLGSVAPDAVFKSFIRYPTPWWKATGVCHGSSLTDLPIRQCYYWTETQPGQCGSTDGEAVLMVYNDGATAEFWGGLRSTTPQAGPASIRGCGLGADAEDDNLRLRENWRTHLAPATMVAELHRQILALHNVPFAPEPLEAVYANWSDDPFGAGVHIWNRGVQYWRTVEDMTQPIKDLPCYVCGEAYSTMQTWVEGALATADLVQQRFNLQGRVA